MTVVKHCVGLFVSSFRSRIQLERRFNSRFSEVLHDFFDREFLALRTLGDPFPTVCDVVARRPADLGRRDERVPPGPGSPFWTGRSLNGR